MEYVSEDYLNERFADILSNCTHLTYEGQIGLPKDRSLVDYWLGRFTHIVEEYSLRNKGLPPADNLPQDRILLPNPTSPETPRGVEAFRALAMGRGTYLARFGKRQHLEEALKRGRLRIGAARGYADPSLNSAVRDDEMSITVEALPSETTIRPVSQPFGTTSAPLRLRGNVQITATIGTDYYVYCLTNVFAPRLFDDFSADACIVFRDPRKFLRRLTLAVRRLIGDWHCLAESVEYFDPLTAKLQNPIVALSKHFRYSYQSEFRVIWVPQEDIERLEPIFVELGSLEDIASLII